MRKSIRSGEQVCLVMALCLVGTQTGIAGGGEDLPPPTYVVGDTLHWRSEARGEWTEEAVAIEGDIVTWVSENGDRIETSTNFALPPQRFDQEAFGSGTYGLIDIDGEIFPLQPGKRSRISYTRSDIENGARLDRICTVGEAEVTEVPAGTFDTVPVTCQQLNRTKIWYYAPDLGSVVRYVNTHRFEGTDDQVLVAIERADHTP